MLTCCVVCSRRPAGRCHLRLSLWLQGEYLVFIEYCVNPVHEVSVVVPVHGVSPTPCTAVSVCRLLPWLLMSPAVIKDNLLRCYANCSQPYRLAANTHTVPMPRGAHVLHSPSHGGQCRGYEASDGVGKKLNTEASVLRQDSRAQAENVSLEVEELTTGSLEVEELSTASLEVELTTASLEVEELTTASLGVRVVTRGGGERVKRDPFPEDSGADRHSARVGSQKINCRLVF